ncbi:transposase-like protein [Paraburkholderia atlantica]
MQNRCTTVIAFPHRSSVARCVGISGSSSACAISKSCCSSAGFVSYETVRRWCDKFGACFAHRVKASRRKPGTTWHLDEVFVRLRGEPYLLWRAVDQDGAELDILLQKHRDKAAAKRFFERVLAACSEAPRKIVTDQLRSYRAAKAEIPALACVKHVFVKASARVNKPGRKQSSADPRTRATHAWLSRSRAHAGFPIELRSDPAALRAEATPATRLALSQTACHTHRRLASLHRDHPSSAGFLSKRVAPPLLRREQINVTVPANALDRAKDAS